MNHVIVYSKPGCCLCDIVKAKLSALQRRYAFEWRGINILDDAEAFEEFSEEIPVIFINGRKAFKFHFDEAQFIRRLRA
jgi:glutaredoxin